MTDMSIFAKTILEQKYSHTKKDGTLETWEDIAKRVVKHVMRVLPDIDKDIIKQIEELVKERKFMPGGRYLYAAGKAYHQVQNCLLLRADDSREGWAELLQKSTMALMTGAGIGIDYSAIRPEGSVIRKTGGHATGPISLMQMVNEAGRGIMQGGSRRSAIWAGLNWKHADIHKFIQLKNWSQDIRTLKEKDFNFPAPMDGTNISVILDKSFFEAYDNEKNPLHAHARGVYWSVIEQMLSSAEPGISVDYDNSRESLRNAPVTAQTKVLTNLGYKSVEQMINTSHTVWTGKQWVDGVIFKLTNPNAELVKVSLTNGRSITCDPSHPFMVVRYLGAGARKKTEVVRINAIDLNEDDKILSELPLDKRLINSEQQYGLGFIYGDGSINNGRGEISVHSSSKIESFNRAVAGLCASTRSKDNRAYFKYPVDDKSELLTSTLSESFIAGWFDADGCYVGKVLRISNKSRTALSCLQDSLDLLGIKSIIREDGESSYVPGNIMYTLGILSSSLSRFKKVIPTTRISLNNITEEWKPYRESQIRIKSVEFLKETAPVYCCDVGVEEHSFMAEGVIISNCNEITSEDDSDICNIGSLNLARFNNIDEFKQAVKLSSLFLLAGTLYSDVPYAKVDMVRTKNRRLGLGLMGVHEWLLKRDKPYGEDAELTEWLTAYARSTEIAESYADQFGISAPIKTRAIAPTGTIGILAETTTGCEPIFCVAYKRRYLKGNVWHYQYVVDPTAKRLIDQGIPPERIEDTYSLADNIERRVAFQAYLQQFVDHGISSTINLPTWGSELNNTSTMQDFGKMLIKYLPKLRGVTCYPEGARGGQPLTPIKYQTAIKHTGEIFIEAVDVCDLTKGGSCSS